MGAKTCLLQVGNICSLFYTDESIFLQSNSSAFYIIHVPKKGRPDACGYSNIE